MNLNINSNFDKMNDNLWTNKKPYQIICIALAFVLAIVIVLILSPHLGNTVTSYIVIFLVCPLGYIGFFNKNGLDFMTYQKIKRSNVANGKLLYRTQLRKHNVVANSKKRNRRRKRRR